MTKQIKASRETIGKYERNEAVPSVETAKNIAGVFDVSLDYLVGDVLRPSFDKRSRAFTGF
ncbi:helix-turn-helix domain-containing protein [Pontimicrobium sp. MEBiC01747]